MVSEVSSGEVQCRAVKSGASLRDIEQHSVRQRSIVQCSVMQCWIV